MKSIQQRNFVKEQAEKNQKTNRNGRRKDGARRVPHHHCPPLLNKQTNKQERTEAEAWKQILEKTRIQIF